MTGPTIRSATPGDRDAVVHLSRITHSSLVSPGPGLADDGDPFERHAPDDTLLAEVDGHVVGYALIGRSSRLESNAHVWQLQGLGVDPTVGRRGVGRALVRAVVDEARRRDGRKVTLRVLGHNDAARRLYESEGFEVEGVLRAEFVLEGREVDDVLMARWLD